MTPPASMSQHTDGRHGQHCPRLPLISGPASTAGGLSSLDLSGSLERSNRKCVSCELDRQKARLQK